MFLQRHSSILTATLAAAALLFAALPAQAASRGWSGGGGYRGGVGVGFGGGSYGGWNGGYYGNGGWNGGYYGNRGWDGGYYGNRGWYGGYSPGYYGGYSNYYAQPSYSTPTTITITPNTDSTISAYAQPETPDNRSRIEVRLPDANAQVFFDGAATQQTGMDRTFVSPPLTPGKTYTYSVQAKWMNNGKAMDQTRTVTVTPNQEAVVDFAK